MKEGRLNFGATGNEMRNFLLAGRRWRSQLLVDGKLEISIDTG